MVFVLLAACSRAEDASEGGNPMAMKLTSLAFAEGKPVPVKHTGQGQDLSPALKWENAPAGVKSYALICDDPDAPVGTWVHWVIWNIPATAKDLKEHVPPMKELPDGPLQGTNDFRRIGYGGPMPPPGKAHRYYFKLYALDASLGLAPGATKPELLKAMEGHILGESQLMGTYQRR
jgi:hypothetical protein